MLTLIFKVLPTIYLFSYDTSLDMMAMVDAQCAGIQLMVNGEVFEESTLYRPMGHSDDFVTCHKCDDNIDRPAWYTANGTKLPACKKTAEAVCTDRQGSTSRDLTFSRFRPSLAGNYECRLSGGFTKSINIKILGEWVHENDIRRSYIVSL